jgi:hypothetical protein
MAGSAGAVGALVFNYLVGHWSAQSNYAAVFAMLLLLEPLGAASMWLFLKEHPQARLPGPQAERNVRPSANLE